MEKIKKIIIKVFPESLIRYVFSKTLRNFTIYKSFSYDKKRYRRYSDSFLMNNKTELIGNIIKHYHVFEKGLTMPSTRLGFGQPKLITLIKECLKYIKLFDKYDPQLFHAISVIKEYDLFHKERKFKLEEKTIQQINQLLSKFPEKEPSSQSKGLSTSYFKDSKSSFNEFSWSRHSVRNFSKNNISLKLISNALELARKTPSACNRQAWRTYVHSDVEKINQILKVQGGNRGFGHLTNKLIVITSELGVFGHAFERNQAFVDGGMYAMNLLYALHFNEIATCPLNCSVTPEKDKKLRQLCAISSSEVFVVMIACGIPPDSFKLASSPRYSIDNTNKFVH